MEHDHKRLNESHDLRTFAFGSTTEQQQWERAFPNPMPGTHRLAYRWRALDDKRPLVLDVWPAPLNEKQPSDAKPAKPAKAAIPPELLAELESLTPEYLEDRAAVVGVSVYLNHKAGKKCTAAQLVARIAEKIVETRAKEATP